MKKSTKNEKAAAKEFGADLTWTNNAFAVANVRNYSDSVCFFDLYVRSELGIIVIYSCKVITGEKGDFIAFPSSEGSNKKYYNHAWIKLSDETTEAIVNAVSDNI